MTLSAKSSLILEETKSGFTERVTYYEAYFMHPIPGVTHHLRMSVDVSDSTPLCINRSQIPIHKNRQEQGFLPMLNTM